MAEKDISRAEANIRWIEEYCLVPEGKDVGKPVVLREWQREIIRDIYDTPSRQVIISFPRKNGKTAVIGFLLLLNLAGPEAAPNSQLYSAAQSRDQAAVLYSLASKMVRMSPRLSEVLTCRETAKEIFCEELGTFYKALSADADTAHGKSPRFLVHDELGRVKGPRSDLYDALETGMGAHDEPLSVVISTQAPTDADLLSILIDDALTGADPEIKVTLWAADSDADPFCEETWQAANPAYGDFLNPKEVSKAADKARRMPSSEASFRNLHLNQRVDASSPFVSQVVWKQNGDDGHLLGPVYGGLDLSETTDLTALILTSPKRGLWPVRSTFWLPEEGLADKSRNDRVPYDLWAEQGTLSTTPGRSIEYEYVAQELARMFDEYDIRKLAFDRYNMRHLRPWLIKAGLSEAFINDRFVDFGQGFVSMGPALRVLEGLLVNGRIQHGNHPVLTMCAANAITKTDPAGNRKLDKNKSSGRIDGMVALAMACAVANEEQSKGRVFETQVETLFA